MNQKTNDIRTLVEIHDRLGDKAEPVDRTDIRKVGRIRESLGSDSQREGEPYNQFIQRLIEEARVQCTDRTRQHK